MISTGQGADFRRSCVHVLSAPACRALWRWLTAGFSGSLNGHRTGKICKTDTDSQGVRGVLRNIGPQAMIRRNIEVF
jgi:hypothetical protein